MSGKRATRTTVPLAAGFFLASFSIFPGSTAPMEDTAEARPHGYVQKEKKPVTLERIDSRTDC